MADTDHLLLEPLRHMRGQLDRVEPRLDDLTTRMGHVERAVAGHSVRFAEINVKLDRPDARVNRIEKRLDLVES